MRRRACLAVAALFAGAPWLFGCAEQWEAVNYVLHVADGQGAILRSTEPIDEVLASGRLDEAETEKLLLALDARAFAVDVIGLDADNAYDSFYDSSGDPVAYNLSASRRDRLQAKTWTFPVLGEVPYLAFFSEAYLQKVEQRLQREGLDTYSYELDAYSTLGALEDPIRSNMLRRGPLSLAETIIHELLHNTIWRTNHAIFNESLATFVGRQGAIEFLTRREGADSGWAETATAYYADIDAVNAFLSELYADLQAYYASALSSEEKIGGRDAVYGAARRRFADEVLPTLSFPGAFETYAQLPTNNAWMLGHRRYNFDLDVFAAVYAAVEQDWSAALPVFEAAADSPDDPFDYLRAWLDAVTDQ